MNAKASAIGMTNSSFASVNGLDTDNHYSSAHDLEILARYAMHYDTFRSIVVMQSCTITLNGVATTFENTNTLLGSYNGIEGIKTGSTDNAGYCLASACKRDGIELYCIVLGCAVETDRFNDTTTLFDWGYTHYKTTSLATAGTVVAYDPVTNWIDKTVSATISTDISVPVFDYDGPVDQQIVLKKLTGAVHKGDVIGTITWLQGETAIASTTLVAGEDVESPNGFEALGIWLQRLKLSFDGNTALTESVSTVISSVTITTPDAAARLL
jgi:D-alanyl-D-alanine carboxypeptidase (penicillin-binding protein 5/6)